MSLKKGKANIGSNIKELESSGFKPKQAVAISLKEAGMSKYDKGGKHSAKPMRKTGRGR